MVEGSSQTQDRIKNVGGKNPAPNSSESAGSSTGANTNGTSNTQYQNKSGKFNLRYPLKQIEKSTDYLEIQIKDYKAPGFNSQSIQRQPTSTQNLKTSDTLGFIYLPIPQNIQDTNAVKWGEDRLNSLAAFGVGKAGDIIKSGSLEEALKVITSTGGAIGDIAVSGQAQNLSAAFFASKAVNILGANTSLEGILARSSGQILNPNTELLFDGVKLRSFNFEFDLAPRSKDEADRIKQIIRKLKINMAPSTTTSGDEKGIFIKSPKVFQLTYKTGPNKHEFLNSFKPMALINMSVNYTGSGTYATYSDATPVHMKLALSFQELNPIYVEDYNDAELGGTTGVGF